MADEVPGDHPADPERQPASSRAAPRQRLAVGDGEPRPAAISYKIEVKVRDVSTCGFMAECAEPVRIGSYVSLDVPGIGPVHAQVRWQIGAGWAACSSTRSASTAANGPRYKAPANPEAA